MRASGPVQASPAKLKRRTLGADRRANLGASVVQVVRNLGIVLLGLGLVLSAATSASAEAFNWTHPRRAEVTHRHAVQNARIRRRVKEGKILPRKDTQL